MLNNKRDLIIFVVAATLSALFFSLAFLFTLKVRGAGHGTSGNGNLGMVFALPALLTYTAALVFAYRTIRLFPINVTVLTRLIIGLTFLIAICGYLEYDLFNRLIRELGGGPRNPDSVIYRYFLLNQYTNKLFFNAYTFTIGIAFVSLIAVAIQRMKAKKESFNNLIS